MASDDIKPRLRGEGGDGSEGDDRLSLYGSVYQQILRGLQIMLGQDSQQIKTTIDVKLQARHLFFSLIRDLEKAPFRTNGKAFYLPFNVGAFAGQTSQAYILNQLALTGDAPLTSVAPLILVLDQINFDSTVAIEAQAGYATPGAPTGTSPLAAVYTEEKPGRTGQGANPQNGRKPRAETRITRSSTSGAGGVPLVDGAGIDIIGYAASGAGILTKMELTDVLLFPGEAFCLESITLNVNVKGYFKGRAFFLGSSEGVFA